LQVAHYIALIHKEPNSIYGVSFPDVPGVIAAAETLDDALSEAAEALSFAAEDWEAHSSAPFPAPRSLDALREDPQFSSRAQDAVVAAVPLTAPVDHAA
jgi:predicted RNase H-like HicB family nuclease